MDRDTYAQAISRGFKVHPVVGIIGPRQCGKTTLARLFSKNLRQVHFFDLEDDEALAQLEQPKLILSSLQGLVVIDEIQRMPELFPLLRTLVDRPGNKVRYLILGSASPDLIAQSSESLAGRIEYVELPPFTGCEVDDLQKLWLRGGFPRSYLAKNLNQSLQWRKAFIKTFLEKDIPNLGIKIPPRTLRRFWLMLTHYHGQIFNASELGHSFGIADTTVRKYLDILSGTFMIRQLQPWIESLKKRQVKSPKIYFSDSGIFHTLLGVSDEKSLRTHPKLGFSWEGFALEEVLRLWNATPEEAYFWAIHAQAELDLLIIKDGKRHGFEFKFRDGPRLNSSLIQARDLLKLDDLTVIYPGNQTYPLETKITAVGLAPYLKSPPKYRR